MGALGSLRGVPVDGGAGGEQVALGRQIGDRLAVVGIVMLAVGELLPEALTDQ